MLGSKGAPGAALNAADSLPREIPGPLQKDYRLLQLRAEDSPAQARIQYRELAKCYHPDAGGDHADFLALQQAYERVMQYQQTFSRMSTYEVY